MKLEGFREFPAPRDKVWSMLMDPEVMTRCLPGCEKLEPAGENEYKATLKIGIAAIKGSYEGSVRMEKLDPPSSYTLVLEGKGGPGFIRGVASVLLSEKDELTDLEYRGEVQVGGLIASVGQRMLQGMATTLLHQFFVAFDKEVRSSEGAS